MTEDLRKALHKEIETIKADIVRLAAMTTEVIPRATAALLDGNLEATQAIIDGDDPIDALTASIEERCFSVLALQSPMARDLRIVVASVKIISDIERSADLMVNVAKAARRIYGVTMSPKLRGVIQEMSDEGIRIFRLSIDAYMENNGALGLALRDIDDRLDRLQTDFIRAIFESHEAGELQLPAAVQLALVCRFYERLGDHAVNIGERVAFMAHGVMPEPLRSAAAASGDPEGSSATADRPEAPNRSGQT
jgi:phosphate transport system protein